VGKWVQRSKWSDTEPAAMHPTFEGRDGGSRGDGNACWETGQGDSSTTGEREVAGYVPMRWSLRMAGVEDEGDGGSPPLVPWGGGGGGGG
jgi:hypothetical protein